MDDRIADIRASTDAAYPRFSAAVRFFITNKQLLPAANALYQRTMAAKTPVPPNAMNKVSWIA